MAVLGAPMCLIFIAYRQHLRYPLILAANRDEYYARPTASAHFWTDAPQVLAGRDRKGQGTWLGITRTGRFAAVTNFRAPGVNREGALSRGRLVSKYLQGQHSAYDYCRALGSRFQDYNGFNLLVGDLQQLCYCGSEEPTANRLEPGLYGLSNHLLDTPWPKIRRGKQVFRELLANDDLASEDLLQLLADRVRLPDEELPHTGVGLEWERVLAPIFITSERYGTRSSTALLVSARGQVQFVERTFDPSLGGPSTKRFDFFLTQ